MKQHFALKSKSHEYSPYHCDNGDGKQTTFRMLETDRNASVGHSVTSVRARETCLTYCQRSCGNGPIERPLTLYCCHMDDWLGRLALEH
jgi:hypothetical protein